MALQIKKQNWPHVYVKESPKYRHYKNLSERYDAKWILDLHSNDAFYNKQKKSEYLSMLFCGTGPTWKWPKSFYMLQEWKNKEFPRHGIDVDIASRRPENFIGVEIFSQNSYASSIKFLKRLTEFLYVKSL